MFCCHGERGMLFLSDLSKLFDKLKSVLGDEKPYKSFETIQFNKGLFTNHVMLDLKLFEPLSLARSLSCLIY